MANSESASLVSVLILFSVDGCSRYVLVCFLLWFVCWPLLPLLGGSSRWGGGTIHCIAHTLACSLVAADSLSEALRLNVFHLLPFCLLITFLCFSSPAPLICCRFAVRSPSTLQLFVFYLSKIAFFYYMVRWRCFRWFFT